MADYPDYTQLFNLVGSDIMVPIDIQGAYIMLPVDIQAQWATLEISIVAQTVEFLTVDIAAQTIDKLDINLAASDIILSVNLAASVIILDINIKSITGGVTFNIENIEGPFNIFIGTIQTVGLYLQPDWAAKTEEQKYFCLVSVHLDPVGDDRMSYPVPGDKTLFITNFSGRAWASVAEDRELQQNIHGYIEDHTDEECLLNIGGNCGFTTNPVVPIKIPGGHTVYFWVKNASNHGMWAYITASAYEV